MAPATAPNLTGSEYNSYARTNGSNSTADRLLAAYSEQRRPFERPEPATRARTLATGILELVERSRAVEYGGFAGLPQNRRQRGSRWLGELPIRKDAGVPVGHLFDSARRE